MSEKPISGALFPCFAVDRIGGGQVVVGGERQRWQLVVVYRGRHCQLAKPFLAKLNDMTTKFTERNIHVVAISADRVDRAEADAKEFGWPFEVGYGLTLDTMRAMGLYISEPRYALETDGPYAEPAPFALSTRGTADVINISNAAFSLPDLAGLLAGITFIQNRDYAPGGTLE
jgi:peroxiredoxin